MTALLLAAALGIASPADAEYRAALDQLYDGATDTAIARLDALASAAPRDPVAGYLGALALLRRIEQRPASETLDAELRQRVERTIQASEAALAADAHDARGLLARGGAHGVLSRFAFLRGRRKDSAREGALLRRDALRLEALEPENKDVLFGLGLYDYYMDVLPRMMKLLRFISGLPGGDRERGLAELEEAKGRAVFHDVEVRDQLYEIYAFYEGKPDRALEEIGALRKRYPGAPLWALRLAEHLRDRMGLYAESARVAREILESCRKRHPNYAPVVEAMARVALGEALLLDLRLAEARRELLALGEGAPDDPTLAARAHLLLGRALELEGDREAAVAHYRVAARADDRELRKRAEAALRRPLPPEEVRGSLRLAEARRLREAGRNDDAAQAFRETLALWPACDEARLRVAEDELRHGRSAAAREALERLPRRDGDLSPPWIGAWSRLLKARLLDLAGQRTEAVARYKEVLNEPWGQEELRVLAARGLARPFAADEPASPRPPRDKHSK
jgi:tetratricopeptide (TPR) repeat protein